MNRRVVIVNEGPCVRVELWQGPRLYLSYTLSSVDAGMVDLVNRFVGIDIMRIR
jgi:hypothetical protein